MKRRGRIYAKRVLKTVYSLKILPRWVIIVIDLVLIAFSTFFGFLLRFNFSIEEIFKQDVLYGTSLSALCAFISILISRSYKGIVRHTGLQDGVRIIFMLILNLSILTVLNVTFNAITFKNFIPYSVIFIAFFVSFLSLFNYRLLVKYVFSFYNRRTYKKSNVLIFGAGRTGMITKQVIQSSPVTRVLGFIDNDKSKIGKVLNGTEIFDGAINQLEDILVDYRIDELIITIQDIPIDLKNSIVELCFKHEVKVRLVPPIETWVRGELSLHQIKEIKIEDLLERETIMIHDQNLQEQLRGKRICITGAAGSIGSELVRQVITYNPEHVILIDQAESALFELESQIKSLKTSVKIFPYIADITNKPRIESIFNDHYPEVVFHAAAYKHVPMMETNPSEAVNCNILGTKLLADLSVQFGVDKFVMVSTDKAVNPTNVMGCSKRIAEIYVQSLNKHLALTNQKHTAFITTRFGNVLGSNGSVIPLFKKQIEQGGPVTVTHPEITRYFMTIPEACRLVLEAGVMGRGGEIYIFDMGASVRIHDLAKKMIQLSGLKQGKDIDIVFTGLREGEKLYEELLNQKENTIKTHHEKIMIAKVHEYSFPEIDKYINLFFDLIDDRNELKMVALMKELVPEYKSNYSRFEVLDEKTA